MDARLRTPQAHMNPFLSDLNLGIHSQSAETSEQIGRTFSQLVPIGTVLALHGDLGSGKTTFVRGMARGWGIQEPVTSPTFNLYTVYQGTRQLIHLDAYRLQDGTGLESLMIEDFLVPPWCLAVEWPERIVESLPPDAWHLYLSITSDQQHHIRLARP